MNENNNKQLETMKTKDLVKAAEELNELLFDEKSAIKVEKLTATPNKLAVKVMQASELLVMEAYEVEGETIEADEVTDETMAIINGINAAEDNIVWEDEKVVKTPAKKAKKEVVEAEEVQVEQTTAEMIQECELPALKQIAAEHPEFAKALTALKKFKAKDLDTMKATMIAIVEKAEAKAAKVAEKEEKVEKDVAKTPKKEVVKAEKKEVVVPIEKIIQMGDGEKPKTRAANFAEIIKTQKKSLSSSDYVQMLLEKMPGTSEKSTQYYVNVYTAILVETGVLKKENGKYIII